MKELSNAVYAWLDHWLGLAKQGHELGFAETSLRAVVVFFVALIILRLGHKRFMGRSAALDTLLAIMLGSVLSRAINGGAAFFPTLVASAILVLLHGLLAAVTYKRDRMDALVKGRTSALVLDGKMQEAEMRQSLVDELDILEALRLRGKTTDLGRVRLAQLERNGKISVILKDG